MLNVMEIGCTVLLHNGGDIVLANWPTFLLHSALTILCAAWLIGRTTTAIKTQNSLKSCWWIPHIFQLLLMRMLSQWRGVCVLKMS